jgi:hypothetical protein
MESFSAGWSLSDSDSALANEGAGLAGSAATVLVKTDL